MELSHNTGIVLYWVAGVVIPVIPVWFKNTSHKILNDVHNGFLMILKWHHIVQTSAKLMAEDIRFQVYENSQYPLPDEFLKKKESFIPETLLKLLQILYFWYKETEALINNNKKKTRYCISHSIITALWSRHFMLLSQIELAVYLFTHVTLLLNTYHKKWYIDRYIFREVVKYILTDFCGLS